MKITGLLHVLEGYVPNNKLLVDRASQYGERVRKAEDSKDDISRQEARLEWSSFIKSYRKTEIEYELVKAYWDAYCR